MTDKDRKAKRFEELRQKAERMLDAAPSQAAQTSSDVKKLLHELGVLHIELEMQHEDLLETQRSLETSRNSYIRLYDFAPVGYVVMDRMGLVLDCNLAAAALFGAKRQFLVNRPFMTYVKSSSQQEFYKHRTRTFDSTAPQSCELELALREGKRAVVKLQSLTLPTSAGPPSQCLTALMDITEQKELQEALDKAKNVLTAQVDERTAELFAANQELERSRKDLESRVFERTAALEEALEELRQSEERLRTVFMTFPDSISLSRADDGRFVDVNEGFSLLSGYSREEALGQSAVELRIWKNQEERDAFLQQLREQQSVHNYQVALARKDGSLVQCLLSARLLNLQGEQQLLVVGRDISDLKRAEERYRLATEAGRTAVWQVDMRSGRVESEGLMERMLGLEQEVSSLRGWEKHLHPEDAQGCADMVREVEEGRVENYELTPRFYHADGSLRWLAIQGSILRDADSAPIMAVGTTRDVTEQQRMQQELLQAKERADAASEAKSGFLANMSHEIRTPLGSIMGMTDLTLTTPLQEDQRKYVTLIKESATSLLHLINDLLDISKIEAGKLELSASDFDLHRLLQTSLAQFQGEALQKKLDLDLELPSDIPRLVRGDPQRVGQVLRNLLSNALKFTEQGSVRLAVSELERTTGQCELLFAVSDTGAGIAVSEQHKLFKSFSQLEQSLARKVPGSGLGLAISKQLVDMMQGAIWLESEPGKGSVFSFRLRFELPGQQEQAETFQAETPATAAGTTAAGKPLRILLAEDNPVNAEFIIHFLRRSGHQIQHVETGRQALESWQQQPYDLVLMDIQMQDMDGMQATRAIREIEQASSKQHTPVLALTAYAMEDDRQRFLEAGMDDCITKPVDIDQLVQAITQHTAGKTPLSGQYDAPNTGGSLASVAATTQSAHFNDEKARKMVKGNMEIMQLLRQKFLYEAAPELLQRLQQAASASDLDAVRGAAHSLKGSASTVCAQRAHELALQLEAAAGNNNLQTASSLVSELEQELALLQGLVPQE